MPTLAEIWTRYSLDDSIESYRGFFENCDVFWLYANSLTDKHKFIKISKKNLRKKNLGKKILSKENLGKNIFGKKNLGKKILEKKISEKKFWEKKLSKKIWAKQFFGKTIFGKKMWAKNFFQGSTVRVYKAGPFRQMDLVHKGGSTLSLYPLNYMTASLSYNLC